MIITETNGITGVTIEREPTEAELAQFEIDAANNLAAQAEANAKAEARAALLERLGITAEEAALLLG